MITSYIEYKFTRLEVEKEMKKLKKERVYVDHIIKDLHEMEVFETKYPELMKRYEKETIEIENI